MPQLVHEIGDTISRCRELLYAGDNSQNNPEDRESNGDEVARPAACLLLGFACVVQLGDRCLGVVCSLRDVGLDIVEDVALRLDEVACG